jgi:hypothetical protein
MGDLSESRLVGTHMDPLIKTGLGATFESPSESRAITWHGESARPTIEIHREPVG